MKARLATAIVCVGLSAAAPARAESLFDSVMDTLSYVWSSVISMAGSATEAVTPPTPMATLRSLSGEDKGEFWSMLEDAGYELQYINTEVGLIPRIEATYALRRELSEADREALEKRLDLYARNDNGLIARLERAIVHSLLEASELGEYRISQLKVSFLPLPSAAFTLSPAEGGMDGDHDKIYRAVREQTRELRHMERERVERERKRSLQPQQVSNGSLLKP
jgi:hypothetical protein